MSRIRSQGPYQAEEPRQQRRPDFGPRLALNDRVRLALTAAGLNHEMTWTEVERAMSAVDYYVGGGIWLP